MSAGALVDKIAAEARRAVDAIGREAADAVASVAARSRERAEQLEVDARLRTDRESAAILERARSQARLLRRNAITAARWRAIDAVVQQATQLLTSAADYQQTLVALARRYAGEGGSVHFSDRDTPAMRELLGVRVGTSIAISGGLLIRNRSRQLDYSVDVLLSVARRHLSADLARILSDGDDVSVSTSR
jgi:vacuolar-type H+-ATPase subunit E/Vma4